MLDWPGQGAELDLHEITSERLGGRVVERATLLSVKKNYDC